MPVEGLPIDSTYSPTRGRRTGRRGVSAFAVHGAAAVKFVYQHTFRARILFIVASIVRDHSYHIADVLLQPRYLQVLGGEFGVLLLTFGASSISRCPVKIRAALDTMDIHPRLMSATEFRHSTPPPAPGGQLHMRRIQCTHNDCLGCKYATLSAN